MLLITNPPKTKTKNKAKKTQKDNATYQHAIYNICTHNADNTLKIKTSTLTLTLTLTHYRQARGSGSASPSQPQPAGWYA
jgi:hypothetical protein